MAAPPPLATLTLLDLRDGLMRASWRLFTPSDGSHQGVVHFSADGARLSLEGRDTRSWDLRTGSIDLWPQPLIVNDSDRYDEPSPREFWWAAPDPTGERFVTVRASQLTLVSTRTRETLWSTEPMSEPEGFVHLLWHPSGRFFLSVTQQCLLVDYDGSVIASEAKCDEDPLRSARFSPRGSALYLPGEVRNPVTLRLLAEQREWGAVVATDTSERRLVARTEDSTAWALYDAGTGARVAALVDLDSTGFSAPTFDFSPESHDLWGCWVSSQADDMSGGITCRQWDVSGRVVRSFEIQLTSGVLRSYPRHPSPSVLLSAISAERLLLAVGSTSLVADAAGNVLYASEDNGHEETFDAAAERDGGRGLVLAGALGFVEWSSSGASASGCPGKIGLPRRIRFVGSEARVASGGASCSVQGGVRTYDNIFGVSNDGATLVVGRMDEADGSWTVSIRGTGEHRLPVSTVHCDDLECHPRAVFSPDDRLVVMGRQVFDARTGRQVRELGHTPVGFSPGGRYFVGIEYDPAVRRYTSFRVETARTGQLVYRGEMESPEIETRVVEDATGFLDQAWRRPQDPDVAADVFLGPSSIRAIQAFTDDESALVFAAARDDEIGVESVDLVSKRSSWTETLPGTLRAMRTARGVVVVVATEAEGGTLRVLDREGGAQVGEARSVPRDAALSSDGQRLAWCGVEGLMVLETLSGQRRRLGECSGRIVFIGRRFVVTADGAMARVTRVENGESLRVRLFLGATDERAWAIVEDDEGHWWAAPGAFEHYRCRAAGPLWEATLQPLSSSTPGFDPDLVGSIFAENGPPESGLAARISYSQW